MTAISSRGLKLHQKQTAAQTLSQPLVKFSYLQERPQAFLKTHSISILPLPFIVKAWSSTKKRLHHSVKLKTDSATESATDTVIAIPRKRLLYSIVRSEPLLKTDFKNRFQVNCKVSLITLVEAILLPYCRGVIEHVFVL